jgi:hypothetical protein
MIARRQRLGADFVEVDIGREQPNPGVQAVEIDHQFGPMPGAQLRFERGEGRL